MTTKKCITLVSIVLLAGLALFLGYFRSCRTTGKPTVSMETPGAGIPSLISTSQPVLRTFTRNVPWLGTVESKASVQLTALTAGRVMTITAKDQARIKKGDPVVQLGGTRIEGERAGLMDEIHSLESRIELARQTLERNKENLKTQLATKDQVAEAQDAQIKLETRLQEARLNLETFEKKTRVSSSMDGIFTGRRVSVGQAVNSGQVIGEIMDEAHLRVVASLFPPEGGELRGKKATLQLEEGRTLNGVVRKVLPRTGETGAVMVWIEGPEINKELRPGRTVRGSIAVDVGHKVLAVPESAIVYDEEERPLIFVRKQGAYEPRRVRLGITQNGWVAVLSGVEPDQSVVTRGAYELFYRKFNEQFRVED